METEMGSVHQLLLQHGVEQARRFAAGDKNGRLCVDAAHEVLSDERGQIGIAHAGFAMAALPHKKIDEAVWERDGGHIKLLARIIHRTARNRPRPPNSWARDFIAKNFIKQPIRIVVNDINGLALIAHFS